MKSFKKIIRILFLLLALTLLPQVVFASSDEVEGYTKLLIPIPVCNQELLTSGGIFCDGRGWTTHMKDIPALVNTYFTFVVTVGIVAFAFMAILSGFQMLMSSLNFVQVKKVTTRLKQSASGLVVLMFIWVVLYQINPALTDIKISKIEEIQNVGCCQIKGKEEYYWMKEIENEEGKKSYACDAGDKAVDDSRCTFEWESNEIEDNVVLSSIVSSGNLTKQCDPIWGNYAIGGTSPKGNPWTICSSGCSLSSVSMILSSQGVQTTPLELWRTGGEFIRKQKDGSFGNFVDINSLQKAISATIKKDVKIEFIGTKSSFLSALTDGKTPLLVSINNLRCDASYATCVAGKIMYEAGHYLVVDGVRDGKVIVRDPSNNNINNVPQAVFMNSFGKAFYIKIK